MIELVRRFFKHKATPQDSNGAAVKTFTVCLLLLIPLLLTLLALDLANDAITTLIQMMIGLILIILGMIRAGFFKLSVGIMSLGLGLLGTAVVFSVGFSSPHAVYILCTFHLFIIFTAALVSYNRCYLYVSLTLALGSFFLHYWVNGRGFEFSPTKDLAVLDDYLICTSLILISAVLIHKTLAARKQMFSQLKKSASENREKAEQLAGLYRDLLKATQEREDMAEKYRLLLETATDAILIAQDGHIKFSNGQTMKMFGYSWEELQAMPFADIIHSDDRAMVLQRHKDRLSGQSPPSSYAFRAQSKTGNIMWLQIHTVVTLWDKKPATLNFIQDITNHKLLEQQIQQSQKMEAIGTLAGGIAHDFNNILSGIFAYLQLAENHAEEPDRVKKDISRIRHGADKAADLCRQILMISRKSEPKKESVILAGVVREVLDLVQATLPPDITIKASLDTGALIHAEPGKIHQVVLNLCTNAFQAMAETQEGILEVCLTQTTVYQDPSLNGKGMPPGEYLCLSIRDNGCGMDSITLQKLFDPYFTTKAPGKGTGLGLAVALGIIEDHQGHIRVFSEVGKGAEFQVFFPRTAHNRKKADAAVLPPEPADHQGRLLIVEDEELLGQAVAALLEDRGYEVFSCKEADEAWNLFTSEPDRFDLVLSDEVMPGMTGSELIRRIKDLSPRNPGHPVLRKHEFHFTGQKAVRGCLYRQTPGYGPAGADHPPPHQGKGLRQFRVN